MKILIIVLLFLSTASLTVAQEPVSWKYTVKKISADTYEVHMTASIDEGWHLYAQQQPPTAIATPTAIKFNNNPLIILVGKTKEVGDLEKVKIASIGVEAWQYTDQVDFVQQVKLKANVQTFLNGNIAFQVCTDEKCLPLAKAVFNILLKD